MKVVLVGVGTRGDIQPLLLLGRALIDRGHHATVCASPDMAGLATEFGVPFQATGRPMHELLTELQAVAEEHPVRSLFTGAAAQVAIGQCAGFPRFVGGADVLIGGGPVFAGASVAEAAGIPFMLAAMQPVFLPSDDYPPPISSVQNLPRWAIRLLWRALGPLFNLAIGKALNAWRAGLGLRPVPDVMAHVYASGHFLVAVDPLISGPLGPWDFPHTVTGYWHWRDAATPLPEDLEAFLAAGPPPVYVGFGSMTAGDSGPRTRAILEGVRLAGMRAVLSAGWADLGREIELPDTCMTIGPVSHAALFPRCSAIVHHGGAGTTASAALSGRPQVVVPHLLDQHFWAYRVMTTGLGPRTFPVKRLTAARLASALQEACGVAAYRERADEVGLALRARDGLAEACSAIEARVLGGESAAARR